MKMSYPASFLLAWIIASGCFAQAGAQPVLIDEVGLIDCESLLSRLDNFFIEIVNRPGSQGYAVIFGDVASLNRNTEYEAWIIGNVAFRNFPKDRLTVFRRLHATPKVQFWVVPSGVEHEFAGESWSLVIPKSVRPFVLWRTNETGCPGNSVNQFAELLAANPTARGNIVLRGTRAETRRKQRELIEDLRNIPRARLRFFHVYEKRNYGFADFELWIVP